MGDNGRGGGSSFEEIAAQRPALLRIALRLCGNPSDADDLVQRTCERAMTRFGAFDGRYLGRWMATILNNLFIDDCRIASRRPTTDAIDDVVLVKPAYEAPPRWSAIEANELREAAARLPESYRAIYELHAFKGLSYKQISGRLNLKINTVGSKLRRAREKLREMLEERLPEETEE